MIDFFLTMYSKRRYTFYLLIDIRRAAMRKVALTCILSFKRQNFWRNWMEEHETKKLILHDLEYYQSGVKQLYIKYYQKYLIIIAITMLITVMAIASVTSLGKLLCGLLFLIEIAGFVYVLRLAKEDSFTDYYNIIKDELPNELAVMNKINIQEDDQAYYLLADDLFLKLKKKNTRNFPSKLPQYTLLIGYSEEINKENLKNPLSFFYYDITQITYSENYKKVLVNNTNFLANRTKKRIQSFLSFLLIVVLLIVLYFFY